MFKPSDLCTPARTVVLVMLLAPVWAGAIVTTIDSAEPTGTVAPPFAQSASAPAVLHSPAPTHAKSTKGGYQVRCWQYGRLLFEENHVALADTSQYGMRLSGNDQRGRPMFVAETKNATCLIRPEVDVRAWPR